jgi:hypothetical protein
MGIKRLNQQVSTARELVTSGDGDVKMGAEGPLFQLEDENSKMRMLQIAETACFEKFAEVSRPDRSRSADAE